MGNTMRIYVGHSSSFDFQNELYLPLREFALNRDIDFIFPHVASNEQYDSKNLFAKKDVDLFLAEISYPSLGLGMELGWADLYDIPVLAVYKKGHTYSSSIFALVDMVYDYTNIVETLTHLGGKKGYL